MQSILGMNRKYQSPPRTSVLRNRGITVVTASISDSTTLGSGLPLLPVASRASPANYTSVLRYVRCSVELKMKLDPHVHDFLCMHMIHHSLEQILPEPSFTLEVNDVRRGSFTSPAITSASVAGAAIAYGRSSTYNC